MWARAIEIMLALWLAASPFIFGHVDTHPQLVASDFVAASAILVLSSASFFHRLRRAHLGNLAVAAWLVGYGYFGFQHPIPPGAQSELLVGLVLILLAIIPPQSEEPPEGWRELFERKARES